MFAYKNVKLEKKGKFGSIGVISMNREKQRNSLSYEHMTELIAAFKEMESDQNVCVVILRGEGPVWCAGLEVTGDIPALFKKGAELFELIQTLDIPVIGAIQGWALAMGGGLAGAMDIIIAAEGTKCQCPGPIMGGLCGVPMIPHYSSMPKRMLMEFFLTGEVFDVSSLEKFGIINKIVPKEELDSEAIAFAERFGDKSRLAIKYAKRMYLFLSHGEALHVAYEHAQELQNEIMATQDFKEGFTAFIEGRTFNNWRGM